MMRSVKPASVYVVTAEPSGTLARPVNVIVVRLSGQDTGKIGEVGERDEPPHPGLQTRISPSVRGAQNRPTVPVPSTTNPQQERTTGYLARCTLRRCRFQWREPTTPEGEASSVNLPQPERYQRDQSTVPLRLYTTRLPSSCTTRYAPQFARLFVPVAHT